MTTSESDDAAWPVVESWLAGATVHVERLPVDPTVGAEQLERLGVTERSVLGALALHTGGLVVDHGWLRILGAGHESLPGIAEQLDDRRVPPAYLVVAHDVLGGRFAIDGGGLGAAVGEVCYFGPDVLSWETTGLGHAAFVSWCLGSRLADFYQDLRWDGWEDEVRAVPLDHGLSLVPPPFTREGRDVAAVSRRPVPIDELNYLYAEAGAQLAGVPEGARFDLRFSGEPEG
ncbi:hypothetical protein GCM10011519_09620 [Marmoricola endophyticus]|uniref:DUF2625 family protein n=1 Tax=Marmoricola endophyticus TaxID=2040280 RepID=A0A917BD36_9ACTN|nr:DUF2625 family protein [Marmoricola endophyticus]GGF38108.1 hypothetical protein GCM10011519_09620 [Marmoricola endophyticus]